MEDNKLNLDTGKSGSISDSSSSVLQCNSFRSAYGPVKRFYMPVCEKEIDVYEKKVDKFGAISYEKTGKKVNIYEEIQSYADDTDINVIVARCVKDGTVSTLAAQSSQMQDISDLPSDFLGIYNLGLKLKEEFEALPPELREKFNNSAILYTDERIKGTAKDKIEKKDESSKEEPKKEVTNE